MRYNNSCRNNKKGGRSGAGNTLRPDTRKVIFLMHPHSTRLPNNTQQSNTKTCPVCGKSFHVKPSHFHKRVYCSRPCMAEAYRARMVGDGNPNYRALAAKKCKTCGKEFSSYSPRTYCSRDCHFSDPERKRAPRAAAVEYGKRAAIARWGKHKSKAKGRKSVCQYCGKVFLTGDTRLRSCKDCQVFARTGLQVQIRRGKLCVTCGAYFEPKNGKKTCSEKCLREYKSRSQIGEKSHRWQGGRTSDVIRIRNSGRYGQWRSDVFERDDFTCALCGTRGGRLTAHHIKMFSTHPSIRFDVANGITLCWKCHSSIRHKEEDYELLFWYIVESVEQIPNLLNTITEDAQL